MCGCCGGNDDGGGHGNGCGGGTASNGCGGGTLGTLGPHYRFSQAVPQSWTPPKREVFVCECGGGN